MNTEIIDNKSPQAYSYMGTESCSTILVVDDDENQRWLVKTYMQKHGYDVLTANDGVAMREQISDRKVDIVLLDVSMPGEDGFTLARYLREHHDVGIIMLTASGDLIDRVLGLEIGADDYVTKPFEPRELMARVKAVLRRISDSPSVSSAGSDENLLELGKYTVDIEARELKSLEGDVVSLTSMEFDLLVIFAKHPERVLTRENLLSMTHKSTTDPFDRSIDIRIGRVRKKIENDPADPMIIKTVRGVGYVYSPGG